MTQAISDSEMPEEAAEKRRGSSLLIRWLVAFGLLTVAIALYLVSVTVNETTLQAQTALEEIQATLQGAPSHPPEMDEISTTLIAIQRQAQILADLETTLVPDTLSWPAIVGLLADYSPSLLAVKSVVMTGNEIVISGQALDEGVVIAYADRLRAANRFGRVVVQSITLRPGMAASGSNRRSASSVEPPFITGEQYAEFVVSVLKES